jgi:hypothetical protein
MCVGCFQNPTLYSKRTIMYSRHKLCGAVAVRLERDYCLRACTHTHTHKEADKTHRQTGSDTKTRTCTHAYTCDTHTHVHVRAF